MCRFLYRRIVIGYTNTAQIELRIAQSLTTSSPSSLDAPVDLLKVGNTIDSNLIPQYTIDQYIAWADEHIDSVLSQMYQTPFCEKADFEACLFANIDAYNDYLVFERPCGLNIGDIVEIREGAIEERHIIGDVIDEKSRNIFSTLENIDYGFTAGARVIRLKYPSPISLISATLAAAQIYDRYFMAQADVNQSEFGKYLRSQAEQELNNILEGRTVLHGVRRIGRRLYNPNIPAQYNLPNGGEGGKSMDKSGG